MGTGHPRLSRQVTARAERFLEWNVRKAVFNLTVEPHWLADGGFWYQRRSRDGNVFLRADATGCSRPAFDHDRLARCLDTPGHARTAATLPFEHITPEEEGSGILFEFAGQRWRFDGSDGCLALGESEAVPANALRSPDATMRFVDALIRANRDFDLLIVSGANHDLLGHPYVIRRKWDCLVEHLMGVMPPGEYRITPEDGA